MKRFSMPCVYGYGLQRVEVTQSRFHGFYSNTISEKQILEGEDI